MGDAYEQMKNAFLVELERVESVPQEQLALISQSLDRAAYQYKVTVKETALAVVNDPLPGLLRTYLVVKKTEGVADGTLYNYYRILRSFFLWARKSPEDITANDIRMFIYWYKNERQICDHTLDKYREYICWFFHWAHTEEYLTKDPSRAVKAIRHEVKERQALTQIELEHLRMACKTKRERALVEFMYSTGCRVSELTVVKLSDINWQEGTVHLFGKGKKHRHSYINARCEVALKEYLKTRDDESEHVFVSERKPHRRILKPTVEKIIRELGEAAGLHRRLTPHVLRHTTATQAVNAGMPIEDVSKLLGHASVNTTMIYAKVSQETVRTQHTKCVI